MRKESTEDTDISGSTMLADKKAETQAHALPQPRITELRLSADLVAFIVSHWPEYIHHLARSIAVI